MQYPNFNEEKKLHKLGFKIVAGLDEAGRGPLAGPVVAAAVVINPKHEIRNSKQIQKNKILNSKHVLDFDIRISDLKIRDSKQISEKEREKIYEKLIKCKDIVWGIGIVPEKTIDKINILQATKLAMQKAVEKLNADFLLLDGNFTLRQAQGKKYVPQKPIIKGDQKVMSIAMASIIAKVTRDRIMQKMHKKYPQYGFDKHKGYGTKAHFASLEKFGACKIHRKSFYPVKLSTDA